jgi:hypothetical protein
MEDYRQLKEEVLEQGRAEIGRAEVSDRELPAPVRADRDAAEFLLALRELTASVSATFEQLLFRALRHHALRNGVIDKDAARCLRRALCVGGRIDEEARKFLRELRGDARKVSPEFQALCDECLE